MSIGHYGVAPAAKKASLRRAGSRDAVPGSVVAYFRLDRHRTGDDFAWNHPLNPVKLRVLSLFAQSFGGLPLVTYCWRNLFFCPPLKNRGLGGRRLRGESLGARRYRASSRPPVAPGVATRIGLGLWNSYPATILVEVVLLLGELLIYMRTTKPQDRIGSIGLQAFILFLLTACLGRSSVLRRRL